MQTKRRHIACFRDDFSGRKILFSTPAEIITSWEKQDFIPALERIEEARSMGRWLAGYISYEAGYLLDPALENLLPSGRKAPLLCFGVFDDPSDAPLAQPAEDGTLIAPVATWSRELYRERFEQLHQYLRQGDCYQANLTFPVEAKWQGDPLALFNALQARQKVRHAAFIDLEGPVVLSRSPELFFDLAPDHFIETRPMKGTAPRGANAQEDEAQRVFLANDPKNQAENRMIVDLLRNDISRISKAGTLDVPELFHVETYATVHQMVSKVQAQLLPGLSFRDILAALFPCGSITGAPKISAMKILRQLENKPRDVYCGAVGWIAPHGGMRFNVAIRTISLYPQGWAIFNIGGGVVLDSTADGEYDECLLKGRFATGEKPASA